MSETLTITRPDDWHIHLRDGAALTLTVPDAARYFGRAIVMPNLVPPVTTAEQAIAYRRRIEAALPGSSGFEPLMVLYLTDNTTPEHIRDAARAGVVACKLYPAGATTNSDSGVTRLENCYPALEAMQEAGLLLLVHGEVTDADVDIFDREEVFIERNLRPLVERFPELKIVLEHISTAAAVDYVSNAGSNVAATITAHHLRYNRNALLAGGIRPHYYCLPILKSMQNQRALIDAATSGNPRFFLGTDSAPHATAKKEAACGCAGCYTAHAALEMYAEVFEDAGALDRLESFASHFGPDFYGLPRNRDSITLVRQDWQPPAELPFGDEKLTPLGAGEPLRWTVRG
ncbi:dihydroorotase [Gilvimarinus sp. F26214L]|uniref:dihydroorotase n=1 Tax=Gilvimarinus sp. DZF01 TaxID=3461371 RepID=UPI004045D336